MAAANAGRPLPLPLSIIVEVEEPDRARLSLDGSVPGLLGAYLRRSGNSAVSAAGQPEGAGDSDEREEAGDSDGSAADEGEEAEDSDANSAADGDESEENQQDNSAAGAAAESAEGAAVERVAGAAEKHHPKGRAGETPEQRRARRAENKRKNRQGLRKVYGKDEWVPKEEPPPPGPKPHKVTDYVNREPLPDITVHPKTIKNDLNRPNAKDEVLISNTTEGDPKKALAMKMQTRAEVNRVLELKKRGVKPTVDIIRYTEDGLRVIIEVEGGLHTLDGYHPIPCFTSSLSFFSTGSQAAGISSPNIFHHSGEAVHLDNSNDPYVLVLCKEEPGNAVNGASSTHAAPSNFTDSDEVSSIADESSVEASVSAALEQPKEEPLDGSSASAQICAQASWIEQRHVQAVSEEITHLLRGFRVTPSLGAAGKRKATEPAAGGAAKKRSKKATRGRAAGVAKSISKAKNSGGLRDLACAKAGNPFWRSRSSDVQQLSVNKVPSSVAAGKRGSSVNRPAKKKRKANGSRSSRAAAASSETNKSIWIGEDLVFAKIKGHPYWPARIEDTEKFEDLRSDVAKSNKPFRVVFFGTHQHGFCSKKEIISYDDGMTKFGNKNGNKYQAALREIAEARKAADSEPGY